MIKTGSDFNDLRNCVVVLHVIHHFSSFVSLKEEKHLELITDYFPITLRLSYFFLMTFIHSLTWQIIHLQGRWCIGLRTQTSGVWKHKLSTLYSSAVHLVSNSESFLHLYSTFYPQSTLSVLWIWVYNRWSAISKYTAKKISVN